MNYNLLIIIFLSIIIFFLYINSYDKKEFFQSNVSTNININRDTLDDIKKKLSLINNNTSNILTNSNNLLSNSQTDYNNYKQLQNKYNQYLKNNQEVNIDINKLKIFELIKNINNKELLSIFEKVRNSMNDSQKQILDQYVNISIRNKSINKSLNTLNKYS